jgi:3-oxoacyl-[acyl-carrier protein] reductase
MKFKDKVVLITGSTRGIGRATAIAFAKEGAKLAINYIGSENNAVSVISEIKDLGSDAIAIKCDVSQEDQVAQMISEIINQFGQLDVLVNNAGVAYDIPMFEKSVDHWKKTLETNLIGPFICSKYAAPHLSKQKGRIVNISSTNAINSFSPEAADYDASKAGIITLTKNLAKELAPNILVNAVAPGWVNTDMNKGLPDDFVQSETEKIYIKRWAQPEEIAKAILFLASEDASFVTGSVLIVDGGHD